MSLVPLPTGCRVADFSLRLPATAAGFAAPFGGSEQVVDLLNDRWVASLSLTPSLRAESGAIEAFIDAQRAGANHTELHHMARPVPLGTLGRVYPVLGLYADAPQGAASVQLATEPGATLKAGDMLGLGGLLLRCAADCVADAQGLITVPIVNRLRKAINGLRRASTATYRDAAGLLLTAAANVARFQHAEFATNLAFYSQDLSNAAWAKNLTAVTGGLTIGGLSGVNMVYGSGLGSNEFITQPIRLLTGQVATTTWRLRQGTGAANIFMRRTATEASSWALVWTAGVPSASAVPGDTTVLIEPLDDGWYDVSTTRVLGEDNQGCRLYPDSLNAGGTVYVKHVQFELGAIKHEHVPTLGAAATAGVGSAKLLVEAAATNTTQQSQNLASAPWTGCARTLAAEVWGGNVPFYEVAKLLTTQESTQPNSFAVAAGSTWTMTVALLAGNKDTCTVGFYGSVDGGPSGFWGKPEDCSREVLSGPGDFAAYSSSIGGLWHINGLSATVPTLLRITRTFTGAMAGQFRLYPGRAQSTTIGDSVKATRVQTTQSATADSYITTTTAAATRAADVVAPALWDRPTVPMRLASSGGLTHRAVYADGITLDFVEKVGTL